MVCFSCISSIFETEFFRFPFGVQQGSDQGLDENAGYQSHHGLNVEDFEKISKYKGQSGRYIGLAFYLDQVCVELSSLHHLVEEHQHVVEHQHH